jgi:hypothetical protein
VGQWVEAIALARGLGKTETFWLRNVISAGFCGFADQFFSAAFRLLSVLIGGAVRPGDRNDAGVWLKMLSVAMSREVGAIGVLGGVLAGIAALPEPKTRVGTIMRENLRYFPGFAVWAGYEAIVERYITRRPVEIDLAHPEDGAKRVPQKVKQAMQDAWNEAIGGRHFRRNMVQMVAKYLALLTVPPTSVALSRLFTGQDDPAGAPALARFNHLFFTNAAFVGEFLGGAVRLVALLYLISEYAKGRLQEERQVERRTSGSGSGSRH